MAGGEKKKHFCVCDPNLVRWQKTGAKTMNSKSLFWLLASVFLTTSPLAGAQQAAKAPKIGVLVPASASGWSSRIKALQQGLRQLGYIDGQNIVIEYRYTDGKADRLPAVAAEPLLLKITVIG